MIDGFADGRIAVVGYAVLAAGFHFHCVCNTTSA